MLKHNEIITKMTLDDKIAFCSGASFWQTKSYPQHGIPAMFMCDGPHGLRKQTGEGDHLGLNASISSTCFPTAVTAASTWDADLLRTMGDALGKEAVREGVNIILGPGVNMKRSPLCGRNFEYYSEDPYLSGKLASAWIQGVQAYGVGTSLKHFAANNQELKRMSTDALVDVRALREYYLPAFEMAVKEAQPATVMCAYNKINGTYCSNNEWLLHTILREEWGFTGAVVSDWGATNDRIEGFKAGMDLEMPSSAGRYDAEVKDAVKNGTLDETMIDRTVDRLLTLIERTTAKDITLPDDLYEQHHQLARKIAASGSVLLKNDDDILPLSKDAPVAVIGALAEKPRYQGTGSSLVSPYKLTTQLGGIRTYSNDVRYCQGYQLLDEPDDTLLREAVAVASQAKTVIVSLGLTEIYESEGFDRETMSLPNNQLALLETVCKVNANVIVLLSGGSAVEMPWADSVKAILHMQLAGQAGGLACADLLFGAENPSGKLTETYPMRYEDTVNAPFYNKTPRQADYRESMFVGYRYYDSIEKPVRFPFGFGLSYTTFAYSNLRIEHTSGYDYRVRFDIENTGGVSGAEAAQLFIAARTSGAYRPAQELKGFVKAFLQPAERKTVELTLNKRSFAVWDTQRHDWIVEAGNYDVRIGASSRDIRLTETLALDGEPPKKTDCAEWYYHLRGTPSKQDYTGVYGSYGEYVPQTKGSYDLSNSILEMKDSSFLVRLIYKGIESTIAKANGGKIDYNNVHFKMLMTSSADNPLTAMRLFSPDFMTVPFTQFLLDAANGHFWKGLIRFITARKGAKKS